MANGQPECAYTALYLGYASNLSPRTMQQRCPDSIYAGMARLDDYKWYINTTNFANIKPSKGDVVYGNLFFLSKRDEEALDVSEGVPFLYEKHTIDVVRLGADAKPMGEGTVKCTSYVDVQRLEDGDH